jgi:hypothetical protein
MGKATQMHGEGHVEFTLCGLACDAYESGDHDESVVSAKPGELVTCPECRQVLDRIRREFKGYRAALKSSSPR